jgi:hypothetical protein
MNDTTRQSTGPCRRWYCKNIVTSVTAMRTGGFCNRCAKAREQLGWFFNIQPALRILSWPFLFVGGIGIGKTIFSARAEGHFGAWVAILVLAAGIFAIGLFLRWVAAINSLREITFRPSFPKHSREGDRWRSFRLYDRQGKPVTIAEFLGKIVVMKTWNAPGANAAIDRKVWSDFDDPQMVYLYVYTGGDSKVPREEPVPAWGKATSLVLVDREGELARAFGQLDGPNCFVVDQHGSPRNFPISSESSSSQWCDALIVKRLLTA